MDRLTSTVSELDPSELRNSWLVGDARAIAALATQLNADAILRLATVGLAACAAAVKCAPIQVSEVVRVGSEPRCWSEGHRAFDQVRELTLAAERRSTSAKDPLYSLLFVAENSARVIYNASQPADPFDDDSPAALLAAISHFLRVLPEANRIVTLDVIERCLLES